MPRKKGSKNKKTTTKKSTTRKNTTRKKTTKKNTTNKTTTSKKRTKYNVKRRDGNRYPVGNQIFRSREMIDGDDIENRHVPTTPGIIERRDMGLINE